MPKRVDISALRRAWAPAGRVLIPFLGNTGRGGWPLASFCSEYGCGMIADLKTLRG